MSDDDESLTRMLSRLGPPARDPLFRVQVMERRQRRWFRRRMALLLCLLVVAGAAAAIGMTAGGAASETIRLAALGVAGGAAAALYALALRQLVRGYRL